MQLKKLFFKTYCVSYSIQGRGEPVMLLHGFGEDQSIWRNLSAELSNRYLVITPDIPGSRASDFIPGAGLEVYAEVLLQIADTESLQKFTLIGHSMGGYISLAFAEKHASRLRALGLFHSTAFADSDEKKSARIKSIDFIRQNNALTFLKSTTPNLFYDSQNQHIQELLKKGEAFKPETLISYYESMMNRPDRSGILSAAPFPVLLIAGRHDKAVPLEQSVSQSHMPAISFFTILQNSAHMGMIEEPEKSIETVDYFLSWVYKSV